MKRLVLGVSEVDGPTNFDFVIKRLHQVHILADLDAIDPRPVAASAVQCLSCRMQCAGCRLYDVGCRV